MAGNPGSTPDARADCVRHDNHALAYRRGPFLSGRPDWIRYFTVIQYSNDSGNRSNPHEFTNARWRHRMKTQPLDSPGAALNHGASRQGEAARVWGQKIFRPLGIHDTQFHHGRTKIVKGL
jgi:hypothetical protein